MNATEQRIIDSAVIDWLEQSDYIRLTETQRLENAIGIWEYGKWCASGAFHRLGIKPQIKYRGSRPESTAWDGIRDISDEEGMRIHAATIGLSSLALEILQKVYVEWLPINDIPRLMRIRRQRFFDERREMLRTIAGRLKCAQQAANQ